MSDLKKIAEKIKERMPSDRSEQWTFHYGRTSSFCG